MINHIRIWASTIAIMRIEFASKMTGTREIPRDNSYEIICAVARRPPSIAYLLFDDQPASTMPYTEIAAMDMKYKMPTLISARYSVISPPNKLIERPHGMTAAMMMEGTTVKIGARKKTGLNALAGVSSSLKINFTASAIGCNKPKGPARLGPMRVWMRASARRSYHVRYANPPSRAKIKTSDLINHSSQRVQSEIILSPFRALAQE